MDFDYQTIAYGVLATGITLAVVKAYWDSKSSPFRENIEMIERVNRACDKLIMTANNLENQVGGDD